MKEVEEKLKLVNELKIITTSEEIYNLWSEVISSAVHTLVEKIVTKLTKLNTKVLTFFVRVDLGIF